MGNIGDLVSTPSFRRAWNVFRRGGFCLATVLAAIGLFTHRNDAHFINYLAALIPGIFSFFFGFVPDVRDRHIGWRIGILILGVLWSVVLWRQQIATEREQNAAITGAVESAINKSNSHSDRQIAPIKEDIESLRAKVESTATREQVSSLQDGLEANKSDIDSLFAKTQSTLSDRIDKVGKPDPPGKPDVSLQLVDTKLPHLVVINTSEVVANDPKYEIILWNLESDDNSPLPIPTRTAHDYINPRNGAGPDQFLENVTRAYKDGDRLFGYIMVECAGCATKDYWVSYKVGVGGWYAYAGDGRFVSNVTLFNELPEIKKNLDQFVSSIPAESRIQIVDRKP
jgi:hypothetical protein